MLSPENIASQPVFYLFVAATFLLAFGYFWGRRKNRAILVDTFEELMAVIRPQEQTFTNIGGTIGYHAKFTFGKKSLYASIAATLLLLPRQSWLYLPISLLVRKSDRLFLIVSLKQYPPAEGHLIERRYADSWAPRITNAERLHKERIAWGRRDFYLYSQNDHTREVLIRLMERQTEPGVLRHVAIVPNEKRCFIFLIPKPKEVAKNLVPIFEWLPAIL